MSKARTNTEAKRVPGTGGVKPESSMLAPIKLPVSPEKMTHAICTQLAREQPELAGEFMMALLAQKTTALPGTVFVRREDNVFLKKQICSFILRESEGHLIPIQRKVVTRATKSDQEDQVEYKPGWDFSLNGLLRLNELPALMVIRPERVIVDGQAQMNPYIQVNAESRMPEVVYARCLCAGYSPMGSLVATDVMVRLDVNIYMLENVQAKMGKSKTAASALGEYGTKDTPPQDTNGKPRAGRWAFMPLHSVGGMGLWVNMAADDMKTVFRDHTTRLKFIERLAQSFAKRNALREHPSMPKSCPAENGTAVVTMQGWTTDFSRDDIEHLRSLMETDKLHEFRDRQGNQIAVTAVEVTELHESDVEDLNEDASRQQSAETAEAGGSVVDHEEVVPNKDDLLPQAMGLYAKLVSLKTRAGARKVMEECGIKLMEEATGAQLAEFITQAQVLTGTT